MVAFKVISEEEYRSSPSPLHSPIEMTPEGTPG